MEKYPFFIKHNKLTIILTILLVAILSVSLFKLKIDAGISGVIPKDDPDYVFSELVDKQFGSSEMIVLLIKYEGGIYTEKGYQVLKDINIENNKKMSKYLDKVSTQGLIEISKYLLSEKEDIQIEDIKQAVESSVLTRGKFVSENEKYSIMLTSIEMSISNDDKVMNHVYKDMLDLKKTLESKYEGLGISITGKPIIKKLITEYIMKDMMVLFPLAIFSFFILLLIMYKDLFFASISSFVTLLSIGFTFSLKAMFNSPISLVDPAILIILIAVASASSIHVLIEIRHLCLTKDIKDACLISIKSLLQPIILASITTSLGFASLATANLSAIRSLGIFLSVGVFFSMFVTLFFVPAVAMYYKFPKKEIKKDTQIKYSGRITHALIKSTPFTLVSIVLLVTFSIFGILHIKSDTDEISYFKVNTEVRTQAKFIQDNFFGMTNLYLSAKIDETTEVNEKELEDELIKLIYIFDKVQARLLKDSNVKFTMSLADVVKSAIVQSKDGDETYYKMPEKDIQVKALLRLASKASSSNQSIKDYLSMLITEDRKWSIMQIYLKKSGLTELKQTLKIIDSELANHELKYYKFRYAGEYSKLSGSNIIIKDQISSLTVSVIGILLIMSLINLSLLKGILITIPVFLAVFLNFGIMWLMGIKLNPATAIIASVGLGSGVDYGIHYYSRLYNAFKMGYNKRRCILIAFNESFKGIMINALSVAFGFMILIFSQYQVITDLGIVIALTMIVSSFATLVLLPILFYIFPINKKSVILFFNKID